MVDSNNTFGSTIVNCFDDTKCNDKKRSTANILHLEQLPDDSTYIAHEEKYVQLWNSNSNINQNLYSRMLLKNKNCPEFDFMDGPPFVSGNLHPGHLAVGSFKSALFNYKIMDGFLCRVKLGYDCHGLPALNKTADENNLTIEEFKALNITESNALCEKMIFKYKNSWRPLFQRFGRLADFNDEYMTRDPYFMETCWWVFKNIFDQGNVYKGEKVMPYSYGNQTPLSNFEASQNYKEKETKSIYVGFEIKSDESSKLKTYFVAWTTTPWTLPANLALCVNPELKYVKLSVEKNTDIVYIMGKECIKNLFDKNIKVNIIDEIKGSDLVGIQYIPLFPFTQYIDNEKCINREYKVIADSYVTEGSIGSAIVHLAPAFGDDDFRVCYSNGLINNKNISAYCPIDEYGRFLDVVDAYKGRLVFDCEDDIRTHLKHKGHLLKTQLYKHSYPYCWRTNTPLIYRTNPSYYIKVLAYRDRMIELNDKINWYPSEIGSGRFYQWLKDIKDWSVSRSTSYATPIPIWRSDDGAEICIGSISELESYTGIKLDNLHPEYVNDIVIKKNGKEYRRISDTFDCWFESGAVPMAQKHYPFEESSRVLESREFLSDFICEGMDQTRGWFYTLMVLSTAIFNCAPYRNVLCTGMILDAHGDKFSKKLGNYLDPQVAIKEYGADVIRTYFINSPVMNAGCLKFDEMNIKRLKTRFTPYINGVKFWLEHTLNYIKHNNLYYIDLSPLHYKGKITNLMDRWIMHRTTKLVMDVKIQMNDYKFGSSIELLLEFIDDLTNWYIKFNRDRIKGFESEKDWCESIYVLYNVIMTYCRLWAPFTPFLSEHIYQHLKNCSSEFCSIDSVLLTEYPKISAEYKQDISILSTIKDLQRICSIVRNLRDTSKTHSKMVIPLKSCIIYHDDPNYLEVLEKYIDLIKGELNCQNFIFKQLASNVMIKVEPDKKTIGQFFRKESSIVTKLIESQTEEKLMELYDKKMQLKYKSDTFDEILDERFYKLIKVPKDMINLSDKNLVCQIDLDLMIAIDHTYDEEIHTLYQEKRLHSAIQNIRKNMGLRPWHKVTVILDVKYATVEMKKSLQKNLSNAVVTIGDFSSNGLDVFFLDITHETEHELVYCEQFTLESYSDGAQKNLQGKLAIQCLKNS